MISSKVQSVEASASWDFIASSKEAKQSDSDTSFASIYNQAAQNSQASSSHSSSKRDDKVREVPADRDPKQEIEPTEDDDREIREEDKETDENVSSVEADAQVINQQIDAIDASRAGAVSDKTQPQGQEAAVEDAAIKTADTPVAANLKEVKQPTAAELLASLSAQTSRPGAAATSAYTSSDASDNAAAQQATMSTMATPAPEQEQADAAALAKLVQQQVSTTPSTENPAMAKAVETLKNSNVSQNEQAAQTDDPEIPMPLPQTTESSSQNSSKQAPTTADSAQLPLPQYNEDKPVSSNTSSQNHQLNPDAVKIKPVVQADSQDSGNTAGQEHAAKEKFMALENLTTEPGLISSATQDSAVSTKTNNAAKSSVGPNNIDVIATSALTDNTSFEAKTASRVESANPASPVSPVNMQENIDKIVRSVQTAQSRGDNRVMIRLEPPELGTLRIDIRQEQNGMTLRFETANARTYQMLQQSSHELRAAMDSQGFSSTQIDVQLRLDSRENPGNDPQQSFQQPGQQQGQEFQQSSQQQDGYDWQGWDGESYEFENEETTTAEMSIAQEDAADDSNHWQAMTFQRLDAVG